MDQQADSLDDLLRQASVDFPQFASWVAANPAFRDFAQANRAKIGKKLKQADREDCLDALAESEIAWLVFSDPQFQIAYEPYGTGNRNPDLRVSAQGFPSFNLEVKRIRRTQQAMALENCLTEIVRQIRSVPSSLGVRLMVRDFDAPDKLALRLGSDADGIAARCREIVRQFAAKESFGDREVVPIEGCEGKIQIELCRLPDRSASQPTAYLGGAFALPYTQKEFRKFGNTIAEKIGQCRPGEINVIAVVVSSDTHEDVDLNSACVSIRQLITEGNDSFFKKNGFACADDFCARLESLSAILFRSRWSSTDSSRPRNHVWRNPAAAHPLPDRIESHLSSMDGVEFSPPP